jgi:hypothetical protein
VIITTRTPSSWRPLTSEAESGRGGSSGATSPARRSAFWSLPDTPSTRLPLAARRSLAAATSGPLERARRLREVHSNCGSHSYRRFGRQQPRTLIHQWVGWRTAPEFKFEGQSSALRSTSAPTSKNKRSRGGNFTVLVCRTILRATDTVAHRYPDDAINHRGRESAFSDTIVSHVSVNGL